MVEASVFRDEKIAVKRRRIKRSAKSPPDMKGAEAQEIEHPVIIVLLAAGNGSGPEGGDHALTGTNSSAQAIAKTLKSLNTLGVYTELAPDLRRISGRFRRILR
jgi:hypothetical protein